MCCLPFSIAARRIGPIVFGLLITSVAAAEPKLLEFHLRFDKAAHDRPFSGRVYVMLTSRETKTLPAGVNWFKPEPLFARDVKDWQPGQTLVVGADALAFPHRLSELPKQTYSIHAVMDLDQGERHFCTAEGNL